MGGRLEEERRLGERPLVDKKTFGQVLRTIGQRNIWAGDKKTTCERLLGQRHLGERSLSDTTKTCVTNDTFFLASKS